MSNQDIQHLVLSGGAFTGLEQIGIISHLCENKFMSVENIETIHCTSIGSWVASLICLDIDFDIIKNYCRRPFNSLKSFTITSDKILNIYNNLGIIESDIITDFIGYLFDYKGLQHTITLRQFYDITKKELYIYSVRLRGFEPIAFHYKTHPDLKLYDAIYMSSTIIPVMKPIMYNGDYYIDGGFLVNYPLKFAQYKNLKHHTVLGIKLCSKNDINEDTQKIHTNIIDFISQYLEESTKLNKKKYKDYHDIPYQINIPSLMKDKFSMELLDNADVRIQKIQAGKQLAIDFLKSISYTP